MPFKDPIKKAEWDKEYYEKHRDILIKTATEYNKNNKEKRHRAKTKCQWKTRGVITNNFDNLYDYYMKINKCEICNITLTMGKRTKTSKCLDHCHDTGQVRNIVCHTCNCKLRN